MIRNILPDSSSSMKVFHSILRELYVQAVEESSQHAPYNTHQQEDEEMVSIPYSPFILQPYVT